MQLSRTSDDVVDGDSDEGARRVDGNGSAHKSKVVAGTYEASVLARRHARVVGREEYAGICDVQYVSSRPHRLSEGCVGAGDDVDVSLVYGVD